MYGWNKSFPTSIADPIVMASASSFSLFGICDVLIIHVLVIFEIMLDMVFEFYWYLYVSSYYYLNITPFPSVLY